LIGVGIALLFIRLSVVERRLSRLSRLGAEVDARLRHSGVEFDAFQCSGSGGRVEAVERGETSLAIWRAFGRQPAQASKKPRNLSTTSADAWQQPVENCRREHWQNAIRIITRPGFAFTRSWH
jgi:hypothetical protein